MAEFLFKTKGDVDPKGKRKVYFTCHPEDFSRYFDKVCEDIFRSHDCAICYTEDMNETIADEDKETNLGQMALFVVPVTFKLLSSPNRAMDDIDYAKREHIPILPLMMESGIEAFYGKPDKFGELQYLNPYSRDLTEISYADKLKKYLESVLISDEMAQKIRNAFDAYIFLSYRKKDRCYANELMKLIHAIPEYRDIAIWYDEFLIPGESFQKNIEKALRDSKLFALLVTPNLLETPNFVMTEEYPAAKKTHMTILPAEMVATDREELRKKYEDIPECATPQEEESFRKRFLNALNQVAILENDRDPMHNFLIGLAYLEGIDVEINRKRGIRLITSSAEEGLIEAMKKLYDMYENGKGVFVDYREAIKWGKRVAAYYKEKEGEESENALNALHRLGRSYIQLRDFWKALEIFQKVHAYESRNRGEDHPFAMAALNNVAYVYGELEEHEKALEILKKLYDLHLDVFGEKHRDTLVSLNNLAMAYIALPVPNYEKALELNQKAYDLRCELFGEGDSDTLVSLNNVAYTYKKIGKYEKELELYQQAYRSCCDAFGEETRETMFVLRNLSMAHEDCDDIEEAFRLQKKVCEVCGKIFSEESPQMTSYLFELAVMYENYERYEEAVRIFEKVYFLSCKIYGEKESMMILLKMAALYRKQEKEEQCRDILKKCGL